MTEWEIVLQSADYAAQAGRRVDYSLMYNLFTDPEIIKLQYLEYNDKDGKELYDGDVISVPYDEEDQDSSGVSEYHLLLGFKDGAAGWFGETTGKHHSFSVDPFEVDDKITKVGNIWQNPELKEKCKNPYRTNKNDEDECD